MILKYPSALQYMTLQIKIIDYADLSLKELVIAQSGSVCTSFSAKRRQSNQSPSHHHYKPEDQYASCNQMSIFHTNIASLRNWINNQGGTKENDENSNYCCFSHTVKISYRALSKHLLFSHAVYAHSFLLYLKPWEAVNGSFLAISQGVSSQWKEFKPSNVAGISITVKNYLNHMSGTF